MEGGNTYGILEGLMNLKLDIFVRQLLALILEYNSKLATSLGVPRSRFETMIPVICKAEPCQDWDGVIPKIAVTIEGRKLTGVVLDGGSGVNIMAEHTREALGLQVEEMGTFTVKMADQRRVQPVGIIHNLEITIDVLKFQTTFTVLRMEGTVGSYPMLLGWPWLQMAKVKHNWSNDQINLRSGKDKNKIGVSKLFSPTVKTRPLWEEALN